MTGPVIIEDDKFLPINGNNRQMNVLQRLAVKFKYLLINKTCDNLANVSSCAAT